MQASGIVSECINGVWGVERENRRTDVIYRGGYE